MDAYLSDDNKITVPGVTQRIREVAAYIFATDDQPNLRASILRGNLDHTAGMHGLVTFEADIKAQAAIENEAMLKALRWIRDNPSAHPANMVAVAIEALSKGTNHG